MVIVLHFTTRARATIIIRSGSSGMITPPTAIAARVRVRGDLVLTTRFFKTVEQFWSSRRVGSIQKNKGCQNKNEFSSGGVENPFSKPKPCCL